MRRSSDLVSSLMAPQAAHTDAPRKNRRQLPSAGISSAVFFAYASLTSSANWKKNCQSEQDVDQILYSGMEGRKCENKQHGDTVPEKKAHDIFLCSLQINIEKVHPDAFQYCGYTYVLLKLDLFSTTYSYGDYFSTPYENC